MSSTKVTTPLSRETVAQLKAGDSILLSGVIYTARDAAHKRLVDLLDQGRQLPFDIQGHVIYYVGPCPAPPGRVIGSAGPTTSTRMDAYTPSLLAAGMLGMIGKGDRSPGVVESLIQHGGVYFGAVGGAAALIARCITEAEVVAFPDLGAEAVHRLKVENMPLVVLIDSKGENFYRLGRSQYAKS